MSKKLEKLRNWGCDVDGALERMLDDEECLESCIDLVIEDENFKLLGDAILNNECKPAFEYAHALKGVLANVGLTPMYDVIFGIVEKLRADDMKGLDQEYALLLDKKAELVELMKD